MVLKDFIQCLDVDTYIEIYDGDNSSINLVYEGFIRDYIDDETTFDKLAEQTIEPECVRIDSEGGLNIIIG